MSDAKLICQECGQRVESMHHQCDPALVYARKVRAQGVTTPKITLEEWARMEIPAGGWRFSKP